MGVEEATYGSNNKNSNLLKIPVRFSIVSVNSVFSNTAVALVDGGSTHNFLSPSVLSTNLLQRLEHDSSCHVSFSITSATGKVEELCYVIDVELVIGTWRGPSRFVISRKAATHDMVLGRKFLKDHNVLINHGSDALSIDGTHKIFTNSTSAKVTTTAKIIPDLEARPRQPPTVRAISSPHDVTVEHTTKIKSNTQALIRSRCDPSCVKTKIMMFEPNQPYPMDCLVGKSIHEKIDILHVSIMNVSDITLHKGSVIGCIVGCSYNEDIDLSRYIEPSTAQSFETTGVEGKAIATF